MTRPTSYLAVNEKEQKLCNEIRATIKSSDLQTGRALIWIKLLLFGGLHVLSYIFLYSSLNDSMFFIIMAYMAVGITGILTAFNVSHDAAHYALSGKRWINNAVYYLSFNLQGVSARIWRYKHLKMHHIYPNIMEYDDDIRPNPLIRISPTHKHFWWHRVQAYYAPVIYGFFWLYWILIQDLQDVYLLNKGKLLVRIGNAFGLILSKLVYFGLILVVPLMTADIDVFIVIGFMCMQLVVSNWMTLTFLINHHTLETAYVETENGIVPDSFIHHQFVSTVDYNPDSIQAQWVCGGLNTHLVHHLWPDLPHPVYRKLSIEIENRAADIGLKYLRTHLFYAIKSHFLYLDKLGMESHE